MSLTPAATITLGNLRYTEQAAALAVTLTMLPGVNTFTVTLPTRVRLDAASDDEGVLELDGGEGAETIMTGKVRSFRRGLLATDVAVGDAGVELARLRPSVTYERQSAKDVIRGLADTAAVSVDTIDIDLPLAAYVAHQNRTSAEHIAYLARLGGGVACVNGDGKLRVVAWPESQPEQALRYGREVIEYEVLDHPGPTVQHLVIGHGVAGSGDAPNALRPSLDPLPSDAPAPGKDAVWRPAAVLRTPKAAATASAAADNAAATRAQRVRARCFLLPKLRPGVVIEIQDLPHNLLSTWLLTRVTHRLQPGSGGMTAFEGVSGEGGGLGGLLAAALGALGSVL
ncbi:MAG: hypothetical protein AB7P69_17105 [Candidatus Binatia bacterium]